MSLATWCTHRLRLALLAGVASLAAPAFAQTDLINNGGVNAINAASNAIEVRDGAGATTVNVAAGADIAGDAGVGDPDEWSVLLFENSVFNMSGGATQSVIYATDNAVATITGGTQNENITSDGNSFVSLTNANVLDDLEAVGNSVMTAYSGNFDEDVEAGGAAIVNIFGGSFGTGFEDGGQITAEDDSVINIYGGTFTGPFDADDEGETLYDVEALGGGSIHIRGGLFQPGPDANLQFYSDLLSVITIYGHSFEVNGSPAGPGAIPDVAGSLTGILADGTPLNVSTFVREFLPVNEAGQIVLVQVPEPGAIALAMLAFAGVVASRRSRC